MFGFWKVIPGGFAVAGATVSRFVKRLFGRREDALEGVAPVAAADHPSAVSPPDIRSPASGAAASA